MTSPFDLWLQTNPDLERRSWVSCAACGYLFEPEDCEWIDGERGVCKWCPVPDEEEDLAP